MQNAWQDRWSRSGCSRKGSQIMKIVVLLILTVILSGCATVETWEGLAREKIVIKDVGVSCSNDVAYAVNVTGERHVSVAPSVVMCWDGSYRERFDVCHSNDFRVVTNECHLGKVDLKNSDSHLVVVSADQWKDDAYLSREILQGRRWARQMHLGLIEYAMWKVVRGSLLCL